MAKSVTVIDNTKGKAQLPAHLRDMLDEDDKNIADKNTTPSLSFEGKVWQVSVDGKKTKLMKKDEDGDEQPIAIVKVVVLNYAKKRGRAYYEGVYDASKPGAPTCWSDDGVRPSHAVEEPVSDKCEGCPMSVKGSRQTDAGRKIAACSQHLMVAVVPANDLNHVPLRLKLAITSVWDADGKEEQAKGWYAFDQYVDKFRQEGIPHTGLCVTKIKFDKATAYPKLLFASDRWLNEEEAMLVKAVWKSDLVTSLLSGTWTPAGADGVPALPAPSKTSAKGVKKAVEPDDDDGEDDDTPLPPKKASKAAPKPAVDDDDDDDDAPAPKVKVKKVKAPEPDEDDDDDAPDLNASIKKNVAAAAKAQKAKKAAEPDEDDDDDEPAPKAKAKKAKAPEPDEDDDDDDEPAPKAKGKKSKASSDEDGIDDLLGEWGV